ncbi:MAG: hypothetical protein E6P95_00675 [Candidatus Moraniibacteriota bacterium]|nr:MAG: hypothetical protein E6P95_00675 [Candidatus Moranbacteria bacterium]
MNEQPGQLVSLQRMNEDRGESEEVPKRDPADVAERERILGPVFLLLKRQRQLLQREKDQVQYLESLRSLGESMANNDGQISREVVDKTVKEIESLVTYGSATPRRKTVREELSEIIQTGQYDDACSLLQSKIEATRNQYEELSHEIRTFEEPYREEVKQLKTLLDIQQKTASGLTDKAILSSVAAMQSMPPISNSQK